MTQNISELENILKKIEGKVLIIDHKFGDPDGIASKYAWSHILKTKFGLESDIAYEKAESHPVTETLVKHLAYKEMIPLESINANDYNLIMHVDTNPSFDTNPFYCEKENPLLEKSVIIDHHEPNYSLENALYVDIEPDAVSATSIQTIEYMKNFNIELKKEDDTEVLIATALWLGWDIDYTVRNKSPTSRDFSALEYISNAMSRNLKNSIGIKTRSEPEQRAIGKALSEYKTYGTFALGYCGDIVEKHRDVLPQIADILLEEEGMTISIAWALVNKMPSASVRTKPTSQYQAKKIAQAFGGDGHINAAGFTIKDLGIFGDYPPNSIEKFVSLTHDMIVYKIEKLTGIKSNNS